MVLKNLNSCCNSYYIFKYSLLSYNNLTKVKEAKLDNKHKHPIKSWFNNIETAATTCETAVIVYYYIKTASLDIQTLP